MKKGQATTATTAATNSIPQLWYTSDISSILEGTFVPRAAANWSDVERTLAPSAGFDPRSHIASFIHQPTLSHQTESSENNNLINSSSESSISKQLNQNKSLNCTASAVDTGNTVNLINGMASSQLLAANAGAIAFPSNAHQQQTNQQQVQQSQQQAASQLQNNANVHHLLSQNLLNNSNNSGRGTKGKRAQANTNGPQASNGIANLPTQTPLFLGSTSVAFPGNPLQPQLSNQAFQNQQQQQQHQNSRQSSAQQQQQMQHSPQHQQGVLLSSLNPGASPLRSLVNNPSSSPLASPNAVAVAAAVAAAQNQSSYVANWPCPACKIGFRSANELQTHLSAHFVPSQNANSKASSVDSLGHPNHFNATSTNNAAQGSQQQQQQQQPSHNQTQFNHAANVTAKKDSSVHMKKDKSVPCNVCGKLFTTPDRVRVHVRVAHGEKTCSCEICGCGFSYRCKLVNHMRTHTGDKPFTCEICGRSFSQKNHLKRHHMIHTGERPFPCEICGRSFYRKDKLTRHRRIHTNTNPGGRGARNSAASMAKNVAAASMVLNTNNVNVDVAAAAAVAAAASNKAAAAMAPTIAQSFSSLPGATIQLIPVSMAAQLRGTAGLGQNQSWVPLAHQHTEHRTASSEQKSPNDGRQQAIGLKLSN